MKIKDALGLGTGGERLVIPAAVWVPVAVVATLLGAAVLRLIDTDSPVTTFLVVAGAMFLVVPTSTFIAHRRSRHRD